MTYISDFLNAAIKLSFGGLDCDELFGKTTILVPPTNQFTGLH